MLINYKAVGSIKYQNEIKNTPWISPEGGFIQFRDNKCDIQISGDCHHVTYLHSTKLEIQEVNEKITV